MSARPRIAAVILAGGKGERLGGVIKANIEIGGLRLLERVTSALDHAVSPIFLAHGAFDPALLRPASHHVPIADLAAAYHGPLAGVAAAVASCLRLPEQPHYLASAAVDTPFFPQDFVARALAAIGAAPAIIGRYGGQDYPTNAVWRLADITSLPADTALGTAPHSLKRLAATLGALYLDWPMDAAGDPFANVNTPDDLQALRDRAAAPRRR